MNRHAPLSPAAELHANVSVPFERAFAMPKAVYTSPEFLALEQKHVFAQDWLCAGRAESLPDAGDYLTMEIAGEPVVVLRDRDGAIRAMSNVCRHRMSTLLQGRGKVRAITCPYHAWTYNLDGSLRGAPAMTLNEGFCKEALGLPAIRCEVWQGWIMVTLNPEAPAPAEALSEVTDLIAPFDMTGYRETFRENFRWATNWKVLAENFMESYHLPMCHAGTIGGASKLEEMVCPTGGAGFNYHWILKNDSVPLALAHPSNTTLEGDDRRKTWLLAIYPSLLITLTPGYFWYLSLTPDGPGHVQVLFGGGMSEDWLADPAAEAHLASVRALLDDVNVEDKGCTEKVYRGLCSDLAQPGPLSHLERPNFEFAQYLARRIPA
ncbi:MULTISPECIES: aromatic ring-hydroxylating dioxygenase subunit alpha [Gemmobacter]|uniref:Phenylpropionate dioxygenase-like ring-hydroxylating dioxygenase large terminal subunit n=2 Tax=Gemmobacter TaxID=204456 RepID=A0A2T6BB25_9RHOB|nr:MULTISPECIES: SRPBCC family protein [Gemmobacter]OJY27236.1 MAG: (2Fe-2S)-binding protein [Rhodobacterales bacterium 65-51]PTX53284.1 phenylpropionate dioxygenase-like ring-hydroxylating dioxygenase large terminal subunit [Gemmobacter caeni]TWJ05395.1 phenylpropionate dioxygenase-like ring-hydroxylating dioxygenase large terminal subunit [Gemmobacter caeni]GHC16269.1 (2Fe-2S)-binding protein [Gemmobacter nanjingensis]